MYHFTRRVRVSLFICVPKDGSGKGIVLNINHDIVAQSIGNTLIGVSPGKEISKGNATQHTSTLQEERIKERNDKTKD